MPRRQSCIVLQNSPQCTEYCDNLQDCTTAITPGATGRIMYTPVGARVMGGVSGILSGANPSIFTLGSVDHRQGQVGNFDMV